MMHRLSPAPSLAPSLAPSPAPSPALPPRHDATGRDGAGDDVAVCVDRIARRLLLVDDGDLLPLDLTVAARLLPAPLRALLAGRARAAVPLRCSETLSNLKAQCEVFDTLMAEVSSDAGDAPDAARRATRVCARLCAGSGTVPTWHRARVAALRDERERAEREALEACSRRGEMGDSARVDAAVLASVRGSTRDVAWAMARVMPAAYAAALVADDADARARLACDVYVLCGRSMVARVIASARDDVAVLQALVDVYDFCSFAQLRAHLEAVVHPRDLLVDPEVAASRNAAEMRRASRRQARAGGGAGGGAARVVSLRRQRSELEHVLGENRKLAAKVRRLTAAAAAATTEEGGE